MSNMSVGCKFHKEWSLRCPLVCTDAVSSFHFPVFQQIWNSMIEYRNNNMKIPSISINHCLISSRNLIQKSLNALSNIGNIDRKVYPYPLKVDQILNIYIMLDMIICSKHPSRDHILFLKMVDIRKYLNIIFNSLKSGVQK